MGYRSRRPGVLRCLPCALLILALLGGCDSADTPPPSPAPPAAPESAGNDTAPTASVSPDAPRLTVTLLPAEPRTGDDLRARVGGGAGSRLDFTWEIDGREVADLTGELLPAGRFARGETVAVTVQAGERSATDRVTVVNTPPEVLEVTYTPPVVRPGVDLTVRPLGRDPDDDELSYRYTWFVNGEEQALADAPVLAGDAFGRGDRIAVEVVPFDGRETGGPYRTGEIAIVNAPPRFVTSPPTSFRSETYVYRARAEDTDGDALTYTLEAGPEGMAIDPSSGEVRWTIGPDQAGEHVVRIAASDGEEADVQEFRIDITLEEAR